MREDNLSRRATAALIDLGMFFVLFGVVFHLLSEEVHRGRFRIYVLPGWRVLFIPVVWAFYYPFTESCFGKTLGKLLCGVSVISVRGGDLTFGQALLRRLLDPVEVWFGFGVIGYAVAALSEDGRRWGDKLGDTRVVRDGTAQQVGPANSHPPTP